MQGLSVYRKTARLLNHRIKIKEADEQEMKDFHRWSNPDREIRVSYNPNVTNFVAKDKQKVIGFAQLVRHNDSKNFYPGYRLFSLIVKPLYRGMGTGTALTEAVIKRAKSENAMNLLLLVNHENYPAVNLYRKLGFRIEIIAELEEKLEKERLTTGRRRVCMVKDLGF